MGEMLSIYRGVLGTPVFTASRPSRPGFHR